jgi:acetyltransferase-like isoleucine patch superfamily enzyme
VTDGAVLKIGNHVLINNGFVVSANEHVEIGANTLIGEYVSIRDADHAFFSTDIPIAHQGMVSQPIHIGEDVWIGRGAVILKGVTIGMGAVVGANSVVTKDVAKYDIVAGAPARRIKSRRS